MFPVEKCNSHIERIRSAVTPERAEEFFWQLQAVYSTMAVLEITKHLCELKFVQRDRDEVVDVFFDRVPYSNLAYVMRIQDFHRGALVTPERCRGMQVYGTVHVATRQSHGTGYVEVAMNGTVSKVRMNNSKVELDKPLVQRAWSFKTDDMADFVDIRRMNQQNFNGLTQFLWDVGYPKPNAG